MTERMHPQDLRTLVAACLLSGQPAYRDQFREASTSVADAFIAELERTAKPEPERVPNPCAGLTFESSRYEFCDGGLKDRIVRLKMEEMVAKEEAEMVQKIKDEGAHAERKRIVSLLVESEDLYLRHRSSNSELFEEWDTLKSWDSVWSAIEPKP